MEEVYRDIIGYEGKYQVSNLGNVKSLPKGDGNGNKERLLKQEINKRKHTNYRRVSLSSNGNVKRFLVHRLVGEAFIANPDNKPQINHIDNNGENNNSNNLEWVTGSENMIHAEKQGRNIGLPITWEMQRAKALMTLRNSMTVEILDIEFRDEGTGKLRWFVTYRCKVCKDATKKRRDSVLLLAEVCSRTCNNKLKQGGPDEAQQV